MLHRILLNTKLYLKSLSMHAEYFHTFHYDVGEGSGGILKTVCLYSEYNLEAERFENFVSLRKL